MTRRKENKIQDVGDDLRRCVLKLKVVPSSTNTSSFYLGFASKIFEVTENEFLITLQVNTTSQF